MPDDDLTAEEIQRIHEERRASEREIMSARWGNVRKPVRDAVENMNEEDVRALLEMVSMAREVGVANLRRHVQMAQTVAQMGKFSKWIVLTAAAVASAIITIMTAFRALSEHTGK